MNTKYRELYDLFKNNKVEIKESMSEKEFKALYCNYMESSREFIEEHQAKKDKKEFEINVNKINIILNG